MQLYLQVSEKESSKHLLPVLKIINYTLNKYHNEITKTISYLKENKSPTRKWFEFIYCILAGTQVRTKIVKKSYRFCGRFTRRMSEHGRNYQVPVRWVRNRGLP